MINPVLAELERLIRKDPARRGLIATEPEFGPLLVGHLASAARDLANHARSVVIVTGFYIPKASPPAAETDGPLGAVMLAEVLIQLGVDANVLTDLACLEALHAAARNLPSTARIACGIDSFYSTGNSTCISQSTHIVAIERVGPSHTMSSVRQQLPDAPGDWDRFAESVTSDSHDHCYNMRGDCIDQWTAPLHHLFEEARSSTPRIKTIGIGDGGNEIGMGAIPWTELARRLPDPPGGKIACRIPCDWTILAGVSNWGGYALAAAIAYLRGRVDILEPWTCSQQKEWLEAVVRDGPAVDGVTRCAQPTVDGLPFATYIQPWDAMRQLLGLRR